MATPEVSAAAEGNSDRDRILMQQVRDDVPGAFDVLVQRYQDRLLRILTCGTGRQEEAEDLTRRILLRVHKIRKAYKPDQPFSTWIFAIMYRMAMDHFRVRGQVAPLDSMPANVSSNADEARRIAAISQALQGLEPVARMAMLLKKFESLRYVEIARVIGQSEANVKIMVSRSRMSLNSRLAPQLLTGPPPREPFRS